MAGTLEKDSDASGVPPVEKSVHNLLFYIQLSLTPLQKGKIVSLLACLLLVQLHILVDLFWKFKWPLDFA